MRLHELSPGPGARKNRKRIGRGHSAGGGKTAGKGHKGQLARSGGGKGPGFEGGQNPLQRRLPKLPGFRNPFKTVFGIVNVGRLSEAFEAGATVDAQALADKRIIRSVDLPVKVLGDGAIDKKLIVKASVFSTTAREKIESAGGSAEVC